MSVSVRSRVAMAQRPDETAKATSFAETSDAELRALYKLPFRSTRTGPLYNTFPYPTKISPEAIAVFLAVHTQPGETVLDSFAGSGSVGLAALLCDRPTPAMQSMATSLGLRPLWGPRHAVLYELGVMGSFAAATMCKQMDPNKFESAARMMVLRAQAKLQDLYSVEAPDGGPGELRYAIWSEVLVCPRCESETTYWKAAARRKPARMSASFSCSGCSRRILVKDCPRATEIVHDERIGQRVERRRRILVSVYGRSGGRAWVRDPVQSDVTGINHAEALPLPASAPVHKIEWGDLHRAGYHLGISHLHHFYTPRNFLAIATLLEVANEFEEGLRDALRLLVLSYSASHSTLMTRVVAKTNQSDFSVTSAQSGVLYVSALPIEKNVFEGVLRKIAPFRDSFALTQSSRSTVRVENRSSTQLLLKNNSVHYAFTDPPFGDYIPYAEINQINEAWLGRTTDRTEEVIVSGAQGKSVQDYGRMMAEVFAELARVLKPRGLATVVFHSADAKVWRSLSEAYAAGGFRVEATSVLDKSQPTFKQTVSEDSVKGDPLILLRNECGVENPVKATDVRALLNEILSQASQLNDVERQPHRLYSRFVARCLELGMDVSMGAKEFYGMARASAAV